MPLVRRPDGGAFELRVGLARVGKVTYGGEKLFIFLLYLFSTYDLLDENKNRGNDQNDIFFYFRDFLKKIQN